VDTARKASWNIEGVEPGNQEGPGEIELHTVIDVCYSRFYLHWMFQGLHSGVAIVALVYCSARVCMSSTVYAEKIFSGKGTSQVGAICDGAHLPQYMSDNVSGFGVRYCVSNKVNWFCD